MMRERTTVAKNIGEGVLAGLAGTVVMTAFQKLVEMPLSRREDSYAPADFAERVLPIHPRSARSRWQLNYVTHFALGAMWGAAFGIAARHGLRGQRAVAAVFGTVYTSDVLLNTVLGLYKPWRWSRQDLLVDVVDKLVQAEATGAVLDRMRAPRGGAAALA
jgi:hypothetical protein